MFLLVYNNYYRPTTKHTHKSFFSKKDYKKIIDQTMVHALKIVLKITEKKYNERFFKKREFKCKVFMLWKARKFIALCTCAHTDIQQIYYKSLI